MVSGFEFQVQLEQLMKTVHIRPRACIMASMYVHRAPKELVECVSLRGVFARRLVVTITPYGLC